MHIKSFLCFIYVINILFFFGLFSFVKAIETEEVDYGPLDVQATEILSDFKNSITNLPKGTEIQSTDIDLILEDIEEHIVFIEKHLKENNTEAPAYALDFLINVITEVSSKIPSETKLNLSNVNFDDLDDKEKDIMKNILTDLSSKKINLVKESMHYAIKLQNLNLNSISTINKINSLGLGFDQLDSDIMGVDLDLSSILNVDELESALDSLAELNIEDITKEIEKSIQESTQIIEEVIAEVAEAIAQTTSDVMAEINSILGTDMDMETYAWLIGVEGVTSSMSFSDAVNLFNEQFGTDLTDEEAYNAIGYDVCWLYGMCD